ncbi:hypothetical protein PCASD_21200 [Puccinia coronata f. sp. avenae]|uniref:Uncharacterized protein n=1 Tax=Puccinia coronata f. sp. avenae TaxID=200324 RepID=A0A2N5TWM9_9BASI|nr:hypothetical protein PCASD_21200 [Puccinia coronata f. sp. avenae]
MQILATKGNNENEIELVKGPFGARAVSCEYLAGPRKTRDTGKISYLVSGDTGKTKISRLASHSPSTPLTHRSPPPTR